MLGLGVGFYKLGGDLPMSPKSIFAINEQNILFDGTNDYVDLDCIKGSINKDNGTISLWVRTVEEDATTSVVSIAADDNNMIEILYVGSTGKFRGVYRGDGSEKTADTSAATVGSWTHVAMTWDTDADTMVIYRDGHATTVGSLDGFSGSIGKVYLGAKARASGDGDHFAGKLDEIAFSQTVLTDARINEVTDNLSFGFTGLATYSYLTHYFTCELIPYASPYTHGIVSQGSATACEGTLENGAIRTITNLLPPA